MNKKILKRMVRQALREDVGKGDITTRLTVARDSRCRAVLRAKSDGILSGMIPFRRVFDTLRARIEDWEGKPDGTAFRSGDLLAEFTALTRATLSAERTALNFVQHLSGVASHTARFVQAVEGLNVRITDTRKTLPLFRDLEKAAVLHGGGTNHRHGLYDAILIKDNHIRAAGSIEKALRCVKRGAPPDMKVEIEVTNLEQCDHAASAGADLIMLDNMDLEDMRQATRKHSGNDVLFEASGNVTLDRIRQIAETGVDVISIGTLTHSAPAADLSLKIEEV